VVANSTLSISVGSSASACELLTRFETGQRPALGPLARSATALWRASSRAGRSFPLLVFVFMLLRSRFAPHEGLYLLDGKSAVLVGIHRFENLFVSSLKFLQ
jgi:hypothetical protein